MKAFEQLSAMDLSDVIIAVDFDGTCVTHEFPAVGEDVPHAADVLKTLDKAGAKLILWTMRSDRDSAIIGSPIETDAAYFLQHARTWFDTNDIRLFGSNENPSQSTWTDSPKAYAQIYIDDAALGCPLIHGHHSRPYVDWLSIATQLVLRFEDN